MSKYTKKKTDILFIIPPYHKRHGSGSLFPLGISSIIACLEQKDYTYEYIDCTRIVSSLNDEDLRLLDEKLKQELLRFDPRLVGIGPCVTPGAKGLITIANCCISAFGKDIIFAGGPFASLPTQEWFFYEYLGLMYLIKGDGEEAICNAIGIVRDGGSLFNCSNVSTAGAPIMNINEKSLDELPFSKRIQIEKNTFSDRRRLNTCGKTAHIVASRGCPYSCSYCVSGNIKMPFRKRSAMSIVAEMEYLSENYGIKDIVFYDDCFFTSPLTVHREICDFCNLLKEKKLNMTWQIEIRPDIIIQLTDDELVLLSESGCRQMNIGVEKTYDNGASMFGKRFNYNELKSHLAHIHEVCQIQLTGTFILGGKGETKDSVRKLIKASARMNLDQAEYSPLFVYPDTPIYKEMFSNPKEWFDVIMSSNDSLGEVVYEDDVLDKDTLQRMVRVAYKFFYKGTKYSETDRITDRYNLKG